MTKEQTFQVLHDIRNALAMINSNIGMLIYVEGAALICEEIQLGADRIIKVVEKIEREEGL